MSGLVIEGQKPYHVRVCQNVTCRRYVWDRNISAAINILYLLIDYNKNGNERPAAFRRAPPSAVAADALPVAVLLFLTRAWTKKNKD